LDSRFAFSVFIWKKRLLQKHHLNSGNDSEITKVNELLSKLYVNVVTLANCKRYKFSRCDFIRKHNDHCASRITNSTTTSVVLSLQLIFSLRSEIVEFKTYRRDRCKNAKIRPYCMINCVAVIVIIAILIIIAFFLSL